MLVCHDEGRATKLIHGRCAGMKSLAVVMATKLSMSF